MTPDNSLWDMLLPWTCPISTYYWMAKQIANISRNIRHFTKKFQDDEWHYMLFITIEKLLELINSIVFLNCLCVFLMQHYLFIFQEL